MLQEVGTAHAFAGQHACRPAFVFKMEALGFPV